MTRSKLDESKDPGSNCPKCCGRGVDRRGRVCGYHKANPTRIAAFACWLKEENDHLRQDNERMRKGLDYLREHIDEAVKPGPDFDLALYFKAARAGLDHILTPTPAAEAQPGTKCGACGDTGLVPALGAPGMKSICHCTPRPGQEHYIETKPKCGTCDDTKIVMDDDGGRTRDVEIPCPDCATEGRKS